MLGTRISQKKNSNKLQPTF